MKKIYTCILALLFATFTLAQAQIKVPAGLPESHPRYLTTADKKQATLQLIEQDVKIKNDLHKLRAKIDAKIALGPHWLTSRLQMFWTSHAKDIYINGEYFDHIGSEKAPVPTVMMSGARSHATNYMHPKLEEIQPYFEDSRGLWLKNKTTQQFEWAPIAQTGNNIQSINREILSYGKDAAFLFWLTGDEKYAELAADMFDVYMQGIYHRNVAHDMDKGHMATIIGLQSFEVIHEDVLDQLVPLYDFLYDYLKEHKKEQMPIYADAFRKWADNIIDNGVPHNNWDLFQAIFILKISLVLEDDAQYADHKGRQYYIDYILNRNSIRQWSVSKLADYGFDPDLGIWCESPGYSNTVVNDFCNLVTLFDRNLGLDLCEALPIIEKAVLATPQYLFPSRFIVGWGDTHPSNLRENMMICLIANAQRHGKRDMERRMTAMLKCFYPAPAGTSRDLRSLDGNFSSFFAGQPVEIDPTIEAAEIDDYVSPTFNAPHVSWFVQRNGMDRRHSLMISENGSLGNHMHANGISMELYGKGYVLAPDGGIGLTLYSGQDYHEYYSQFLAHNTVCVDGISSYPVMKSDHGFTVLSHYPASGRRSGICPNFTYSDIAFIEPETQSDQRRLCGIVNTGTQTGYYIDIFRSRRHNKQDKMHDYFYHNLGQTMTLTAADGSDLKLQPTPELSFAGGHLYAYSYLHDKEYSLTKQDTKATYTIAMADGDDIVMTQWSKGDENRKVFKALSPMTEGLCRMKGMPYDISKQPTLTYVARQEGEAWTHPFVNIFEPSSVKEPAQIEQVKYFSPKGSDADFVGIEVCLLSGRKDLVFSGTSAQSSAKHNNISVTGTYAIVSLGNEGNASYFLSEGTLLKSKQVEISSAIAAQVIVVQENGQWYYSASENCTLKIKGKKIKVNKSDYTRLDIQ